MAQLSGIAGPPAGKTFRLSKVTTLGRSRTVDIRFDDRAVSREHARVLVDTDGQFILEDLQSGNGTLVNGRRVRSARLHEGDRIAIGSAVLVFGGPARPSAVAAADKVVLEVSGQPIGKPLVNAIDVAASGALDEGTAGPSALSDRRLRLVWEILQSVGMDLNEERLLGKILDALLRVFPDTSRGFVILRDPETGTLQPRAAKIVGPDADRRVTISHTLLQYVLQQKRAVLSNDAMTDSRFDDSPSIFEVGVRSVMCAPLVHKDQVLGFILLDTQQVSEHYNESGLNVLAAVAPPASLAIANARMHARLVARERVEEDLRNAARIQRHFLPQELPNVPGYEFADWYSAAHEVGGDFYDYVPLPDNRLGIAVGDVSGKGITAALMMGKMMGHVRYGAASVKGPGHVLRQINEAVLGSMPESFVTLVFMVLDYERHRLVVANAGHLPVLVRRAGGTLETVECASGFPIGVTIAAQFSETSIDIRPGDRICAFTDGVPDAINDQGQLYGEARLHQLVAGCGLEPAELAEEVRRAVFEHRGEAEQADDMALVCFGPTGGDSQGSPALPAPRTIVA